MKAYGSNSLPLAVLFVLVFLMAVVSAAMPELHSPLEWARAFLLAHMPASTSTLS